MDYEAIISLLDAEIGTLKEAKQILWMNGTAAATTEKVYARKQRVATTPKKRTVSAEARKRIGDAQRKRWAATKRLTSEVPVKATKKATEKTVKRTLSTEGRKRIADAQRKRWATTKKVNAGSPPKGTKSAAKKASRVKSKKAAPKKAVIAAAAGAKPEVAKAEALA
jgi:hypothetical protein